MHYRICTVMTVLFSFGLFGQCMDEQTFECELAVARVEECCSIDVEVGSGTNDGVLSCDIFEGCGVEPLFSVKEAECVSKLSCDDLRSQGGCSSIESLSCIDSST